MQKAQPASEGLVMRQAAIGKKKFLSNEWELLDLNDVAFHYNT